MQSSFSVKEAITDAIYRFVTGLDTGDLALFNSAFSEDACFNLNGDVMEGMEMIRSKCYEVISKLDTTHFITNIRVDLKEGELTASLTASALAQHYRQGQGMIPGATHLLVGSRYSVDLISDGAFWRMKYCKIHLIWAEGDWDVITGN